MAIFDYTLRRTSPQLLERQWSNPVYNAISAPCIAIYNAIATPFQRS